MTQAPLTKVSRTLLAAFASLVLGVGGASSAFARSQEQREAFVREVVDDFIAVCSTETDTLERSGAALEARGARYRHVPDAAYREVFGPRLHAGERLQEGLLRGYVTRDQLATVVVEFSSLQMTFGQVARFFVPYPDVVQAHLTQRLGAPHSDEVHANGRRSIVYNRTDARLLAPEFFFTSTPGSVARLSCAMPPTPPPDLGLEQQITELVGEMWLICGARADALEDVEPFVGLLPGRYRSVPETLHEVLGDSAGALMSSEETDAEILEKKYFSRRFGGSVAVLELSKQRQRDRVSVIANFRLIPLDAETFSAAIEAKFGPRDSMPAPFQAPSSIPIDARTFGAFAPAEPETRRLVAMLSGEVQMAFCYLRRFDEGPRSPVGQSEGSRH